jgi:hypothetical protein
MSVSDKKTRKTKGTVGIPGKFEALGVIIHPTHVKVKPSGVIANPVSVFDTAPKNEVTVPFDCDIDYKIYCVYKGFDVHRRIYINGELIKDTDPNLQQCTFKIFSNITPDYLNKKYPADCRTEWPNREPWMEIGGTFTLKVHMGCSEGSNLTGPPTAWVHPEYPITLARPLPPR